MICDGWAAGHSLGSVRSPPPDRHRTHADMPALLRPSPPPRQPLLSLPIRTAMPFNPWRIPPRIASPPRRHASPHLEVSTQAQQRTAARRPSAGPPQAAPPMLPPQPPWLPSPQWRTPSPPPLRPYAGRANQCPGKRPQRLPWNALHVRRRRPPRLRAATPLEQLPPHSSAPRSWPSWPSGAARAPAA